jgi:hypothetical protein
MIPVASGGVMLFEIQERSDARGCSSSDRLPEGGRSNGEMHLSVDAT